MRRLSPARISLCLSLVVTLGFAAPSVRAEPGGDTAAAANAFEQAQRAELARDHRRAAQFYELADSIVATPEALRSAVRNYEMAEDFSRAASLGWSLGERYDDEESQALARRIVEESSEKLLIVDVECSSPCTISDGVRALAYQPATSHQLFLDPGSHALELVFGQNLVANEDVDGAAGQRLSISVERPPEPEPEEIQTSTTLDDGKSRRQRLSPAYFVTGAVVTAGLAATTVWSGLNVYQLNDRYEDGPTQARLDAGQSAELRTNIMIGATAVVGVATIAIAVFTDWERWKRGGKSSRANLRFTPTAGLTGAGFAAGGRF